jgi:rod shape-determining protein MreD
MGIIFIIISLILDGIMNNLLPFINLSLFTPLLTIISIIIIYPLYIKKEKKYLITIFVTGIIYDLLYTNQLFLNGVIFILIGLVIMNLYKKITINYFNILIISLIIIIIYILIESLILLIFNVVPISINKILYIISNSILLNLIYSELLYVIMRNIPKKYKKISIN